jgi:hypothetical protein
MALANFMRRNAGQCILLTTCIAFCCPGGWGIDIANDAASRARAAGARMPRGFTALVRSGVQYNNKTMLHNCGAAHSCSSFADLVIKTGWEVKTKLALTSHPVFMTRS